MRARAGAAPSKIAAPVKRCAPGRRLSRPSRSAPGCEAAGFCDEFEIQFALLDRPVAKWNGVRESPAPRAPLPLKGPDKRLRLGFEVNPARDRDGGCSGIDDAGARHSRQRSFRSESDRRRRPRAAPAAAAPSGATSSARRGPSSLASTKSTSPRSRRRGRDLQPQLSGGESEAWRLSAGVAADLHVLDDEIGARQ